MARSVDVSSLYFTTISISFPITRFRHATLTSGCCSGSYRTLSQHTSDMMFDDNPAPTPPPSYFDFDMEGHDFKRTPRRASEKYLNLAIVIMMLVLLLIVRFMSNEYTDPHTIITCSTIFLPAMMAAKRRSRSKSSSKSRSKSSPKLQITDNHFQRLLPPPVSLPALVEESEMRVCSPIVSNRVVHDPPANNFEDFRDEFLTSSDVVTSPTSVLQEVEEVDEPEAFDILSPTSEFGDDSLRDFDIQENEMDSLRFESLNKSVSKCGAQLVYNNEGSPVGVFKPMDEGLGDDKVGTSSPHRSGVSVGDSSVREIGAYKLDHNNFSGVPLTRGVRLKIDDTIKQGSLQSFAHNKGASENFGSSGFSVESVHRIGILDLRIFNMDRHEGNMLVTAADDGKEKFDLVPIDHGLCLPHWRNLSEATFDWLSWKQTEEPFSEESRNYVLGLSLEKDARILSKLGVASEAVFTNVLCTAFLKQCVGKGLNLSQIGTMMSRDFFTDEPSVFENIMGELVPKDGSLPFELDDFSGETFPTDLTKFLEVFCAKIDNAIAQS